MKLKLVRTALGGKAPLCGLMLGLMLAPMVLADNPSADLDQSQANRLSIQHDYSIDAVGSTAGEMGPSTGGGLLGPFMGRFVSSDSTLGDKDWFITGTPLIGYDSNPEARQLATGSAFAGADINATYATDLTPENPTNVFVSYDMNGAVYEGMVKQANVFQQTASAGIRHGFVDDTLILSGQLKDQFTLEHGAAFLDSLDVMPSLEAFWFPTFSTEVALDYAHMAYFFPVAADLDPDTERNILSFNMHFYTLPQGKDRTPPESPDQLTDILRATLRSAIMGYGHVWNKADGAGYQYQSNRLTLGLDGIRPLRNPDLTMEFAYAHEWQSYTNEVPVTSRPVLNRPTIYFRRHDHLDVLTFRADAHLADLAKGRGTLGGFVQWDVMRDFSVTTPRDFNEFILSTGISYRY